MSKVIDNIEDIASIDSKAVLTTTQTALDLKAPLASPALTGTPTVPTPTANDNSTRIATTEFVNTEISNDVGVANSGLVKTALNASGTAPIYACRAWVNFNGTGTVAIRASGNVSSITDVATGRYTVNFATAMPDANYSIGGFSGGAAVGTDISVPQFDGVTNTYTASAVSIRILDEESSTNDAEYVTINVFR